MLQTAAPTGVPSPLHPYKDSDNFFNTAILSFSQTRIAKTGGLSLSHTHKNKGTPTSQRNTYTHTYKNSSYSCLFLTLTHTDYLFPLSFRHFCLLLFLWQSWYHCQANRDNAPRRTDTRLASQSVLKTDARMSRKMNCKLVIEFDGLDKHGCRKWALAAITQSRGTLWRAAGDVTQVDFCAIAIWAQQRGSVRNSMKKMEGERRMLWVVGWVKRAQVCNCRGCSRGRKSVFVARRNTIISSISSTANANLSLRLLRQTSTTEHRSVDRKAVIPSELRTEAFGARVTWSDAARRRRGQLTVAEHKLTCGSWPTPCSGTGNKSGQSSSDTQHKEIFRRNVPRNTREPPLVFIARSKLLNF